MTISSALQSQLDQRPPRPFRGIPASIAAAVLNRPGLLQLLLQYIIPVFRPVIDSGRYFFVTDSNDAREVMERDDDFPIGPQVGPAMVCGAFALGTDRGPYFRDDLAFLYETFYDTRPKEKLPPGGRNLHSLPKLGPLIRRVTAIVEAAIENAERSSGRLDLVQELLRPACTDTVQFYLGVGPPDSRWLETLWEVLGSLALRIALPDGGDSIDTSNLVVADLTWAKVTLRLAINEAIDAAIAATPSGKRAPPNIIAKMCHLLAKGNPGPLPDDKREKIIRNIAGLAITGCHPLAKGAAQAVEVLLSNPPAFRGATAAAVAGDEDLFWDYIEEALRFFPPFPLVQRACPRTAVIGGDSDRPRNVRAGQTVTVGLLPAMFDSAAVPYPYQFRTDRPRRDSLVFGRGVHACFGYPFVRCMLIALLKPLFVCGFARVPGRAGRLSFDFLVPRSLQLRLSPSETAAARS